MSQISIAKDIVPIGEFKTNPSKWLKNANEGHHPIVITQNGKPAGVLLSPLEYDYLTYQRRFMDSVRRGLDDMENERGYTTDEAIDELEKRLTRKGL